MKIAYSTKLVAMAITTLLSVAVTPAKAETLLLPTNATAVNNCQGALPSSDAKLRKRPLALVNEGTGNAFVTCAFAARGQMRSVQLFAVDLNGTSRTLSCTGVNGKFGQSNEFITKSRPLNDIDGPLEWAGSDFAGSPTHIPGKRISLSCSLLPGMALTAWQVNADEEIGE